MTSTVSAELCIVCGVRKRHVDLPSLGGVCRDCPSKIGRALLEQTRAALQDVWSIKPGDGFLGPEHLRRPQVVRQWFGAEQAETTDAIAHAEMGKLFLEMNMVDEGLIESAVALCMPINERAWATALQVVLGASALRSGSLPLLRALIER